MKGEFYFLGYRFTFVQYLIICLGWTFFLAFIWPLIAHSYFFISVIVCAIALFFAGFVNSKLLVLLLILFHVNKKIVSFYQNAMLVVSALAGTWIMCLFVPSGGFLFINHLIVNTFTVFLYYRFIIDSDKV